MRQVLVVFRGRWAASAVIKGSSASVVDETVQRQLGSHKGPGAPLCSMTENRYGKSLVWKVEMRSLSRGFLLSIALK
jgi:hypothetical protein